MSKFTSKPLKTVVIRTLGIQVVMIAVALLICLVFYKHEWVAVAYGGFAGLAITAYLGLNLLHKTAKAAKQGDDALAVKGLGIVQISRYALTLCAFYFGLKLELSALPMIIMFALVQTAFWFVLMHKQNILVNNDINS